MCRNNQTVSYRLGFHPALVQSLLLILHSSLCNRLFILWHVACGFNLRELVPTWLPCVRNVAMDFELD